ncbi:hypothetical protein O2W18_07365 [Modestobacter sp. VKM Ac-2983]|uniref:hypothetical protein n=1 Tax=Modestobacter sp. VKM Ac-2983 TaxID=3004137 RepID=UPI0022AB6038|nr:hypothetical protein [Modestobacter sp. VKM Ac-2983]MCZ2804911.1 hypothetical protein [Modestobacter sp. VKM Ac-2983]
MLSPRRITYVCAATALTGVLTAGPALAAGTVTITPAETAVEGADWWFSNAHRGENDPAATPTTGEGGIAEAPAGSGFGNSAYRLALDAASEKARLMTGLLDGRPLSDLAGVTYSSYKTGLPGYGPSINVEIDPAGPDDFATVVWEANKAGFTIAEGQWQAWDTTQSTGGRAGGWWTPSIQPFSSATPGSNGTPTTLATLVEHFGAATTITGFAVNTGRSNAGLEAYVDGIGITVGGETTTYDVEPRVFTKADCKDGGWATEFEPGQFANQGQCVSSFASKAKTGEE